MARCESIGYLSRRLEEQGLETYLPPPDVERVYFEFVVRCDPERIALPVDTLVAATPLDEITAIRLEAQKIQKVTSRPKRRSPYSSRAVSTS